MTPKQEAFARFYVETGNASEAYRRAGYSVRQSPEAITQNASKLLTKVLPTVKQLQQKHQKRHDITVDKLTEMFLEDRDGARTASQYSAAISANVGLAKLHGHMVEKREIKHVSGVEDLDDAELGNIARAGSNGASKTQGGPTRVN